MPIFSDCLLVLEIQPETTQKTFDELLAHYRSTFPQIVVTNPFGTKVRTTLPVASVDSSLPLAGQRNSVVEHFAPHRVCHLTTSEKMFLEELPAELPADAYYCQRIERINSQYAPDYALYRPYLYNPQKFRWNGATYPFLQPTGQYEAHLGKTQVRNLRGATLETERVKTLYADLPDPAELLVPEFYHILFRGLMYSTAETLATVAQLLDSHGEFLFRHPFAGLLVLEKFYFKTFKKDPETARTLYQKYLPHFETLPHSYLLQATHLSLHGHSDRARKLLHRYLDSLGQLRLPDFLDLYFSEEDRFSLPYLQDLQFALESGNYEEIVRTGNLYFDHVNNHTKLDSVGRQVRIHPELALEVARDLGDVATTAHAKFIVLAHPRSGSTLLTKLLASHPRIHMLGEIFNSVPQGVDSASRFPYYLERILDPVTNAERQLNLTSIDSTDSVGAKLLFFQLDDKSLLEALLERGYKIIHLTRENQLDRYLSSLSARSNQTYFSSPHYKIEDKVRFSPEKFARFQENNAKLEQDFALEHEAIYRLTYDQLIQNKDQTMSEVFAHLDLSNHQTSTQMRKQNTRDYAESILNYEEAKPHVEAYLASLSN